MTLEQNVVNDEALHNWQGERGKRVTSMQSEIENDEVELEPLNEEYEEYIEDFDYLTSEKLTRSHKICSKIRQVK